MADDDAGRREGRRKYVELGGSPRDLAFFDLCSAVSALAQVTEQLAAHQEAPEAVKKIHWAKQKVAQAVMAYNGHVDG